MKNIGLVLALIMPTVALFGQVNDTGNKVAIGNHTPLTKLHAIDNSNSEVLRIESSTNSSQIKFRATGTGGIDWSLMSTANGASLGGGKFSIYGNAQHRLVLDQNGYVGIGAISPQEKLHIESGALQFYNLGPNTDNVDIIKMGEGTTADEFSLQGMFANTGETGNSIKFRSTQKDNLFVIRGDGNLGIGSITPLEKLHIESGALQFNNLGSGQDNVEIIKIAESTTPDEFSLVGMFNGGGATGNSLKWRSTWNDNLFVLRGDGKVGLGTTSMGSHRLAVEGSIGAREIKVEATGWSDFVFENDYDLRTLEQVEEHIKENGHLPEIPSEAEVNENGINLGEMNAKLLQKIEELTLYLIEQNKKIEELQKEVSALKTE